MIILLDTSTPVCRLTLVHNDVTVDHEWEAGRTLARDLLRYLYDTVNEAGSTVYDITGIGVMRGPGSFTGLRIGMSIANTLADSLQIPIVGESGSGWQDRATARLHARETDGVVLPLYGADAHITKQKK